MNLAEQLHKAALGSKLSINELAKRSDVPYSAMHRFVTGSGSITLPTASKIAEVLGLELQPIRRKRKAKV